MEEIFEYEVTIEDYNGEICVLDIIAENGTEAMNDAKIQAKELGLKGVEILDIRPKGAENE